MIRNAASLKKLFGKRCVVYGNVNATFSNIKPFQSASSNSLTFYSKELKPSLKSKASIIICKPSLELHSMTIDKNTALVVVENPRLCFIRAVNTFFSPKKESGIHSTAIIGKRCRIEAEFIGQYVTICDDVSIGTGTRIYAGTHICSPAKIGKNVIIKANSVIGGNGFGYEKNEHDIFEKFPHLGGVVIEDDVEIGSNTCVDRGTLSDTVIGRGTKIDNLVHVAHNVKIGKNCVIVALSLIGGGTNIGNSVWIAPSACLRDNIIIGDKALVGMGAVVTKNVESCDVVIGVPARSIKSKEK